jgi:hypothetical protein
MKTRMLWLIPIILSITLLATAQVPKWKLDVGEQIKDYSFLKDGKFLFLSNYEYSWLFDAATGSKVYELRVKNWEKKGVHTLVGEKFLIGTDDDLQCYDALTGKLIWKQEYAKISQDDYRDLDWLGNITVIRYEDVHIGINLSDGKEIWRTKIKYNGDVSKKGGWNYKKLEKQSLLLVLLDDDKLGLYQFSDGKEVFNTKDFEISSKLLEKDRKWSYISPDERYLVFMLDEQVAVVDAVDKKEVKRIPIKYDTDFETVMPTDLGCAILGKDKVVFFNDSTASLVEVKAEVGDFRTYEVVKIEGKDIFIAGLSDAMFAIDLAEGKILWESKKEDPSFDGYAHRYLKVDGNNVLITYAAGSGGDGSNLHLLCIDALTGKVNYRTPALFNSKIYIPAWTRALNKFVLGTLAGQKPTFGYENMGFEYTTNEVEGNFVFALVATNKLQNPETKDEPGDGVVIVDPKTGQILFKDYVRASDYTYKQPQTPKEMKPLLVGTKMFLLGDESLAGYDLAAKKRLWFSEKTLKGVPLDAMVIDDVLYIKFGGKKFEVKLTPPSGIFGYLGMEVKDQWDEDPYGFAAYDANTGKQLWRIETKVDPGFLTPNFSLKNNYDSTSKRLYFADEGNIYALQMRADGGKYDYTVNLDKAGIGEMPFKKTYAIQEWPIGSVSTSVQVGMYSTTYTTTSEVGGEDYGKFISSTEEADAACQYKGWASTIWGATAKKCLRAVYSGTHIFAMGSDAIALINAVDGKVVWKHAWDYDAKAIQYVPKIMNGKLIYCLDRQLTCVDFEKGETLWQQKEAKRPIFFNAPSEKYLYVIDEEDIRGYELEKQK